MITPPEFGNSKAILTCQRDPPGVTIMQIHGASEGATTLQLRMQEPGDLYFKCGVYAAPVNSSNYMESRRRDIKL
ncbi:hypothetical protein HS088_TW04G01179 [Tripterygium wilfordii]|uniref:Uncharacterized protein n=1 Tax=Tripterygium wilfordii TaxID=458696 RepID=A0A7J7DS74_TRIWF|nr:hypothetical protein HS088_TW04G01179 [Tripterygium wilfordii]